MGTGTHRLDLTLKIAVRYVSEYSSGYSGGYSRSLAAATGTDKTGKRPTPRPVEGASDEVKYDTLMPRTQPTLHVAMSIILAAQPKRIASFKFLANENKDRDLYRMRAGTWPNSRQLRARSQAKPYYRTTFQVMGGGLVRLIGPPARNDTED